MSRRPKWRDDELALLDSWTGPDDELAKRLGRSVTAVRKRRWRRTNPQAAEKERAYAEQNREREARLAFLRQRINRDRLNAEARERAAAERAAATQSGPYQPTEDAVVLQLDLSLRVVAARLGRTPSSVRGRRRVLLARSSLLRSQPGDPDQPRA